MTDNAYNHNQYLVTKDATMSNDLRLDLLKDAIAESGLDGPRPKRQTKEAP